MPMRIVVLLFILMFVTPAIAANDGSAAQGVIRQQDEALSRDDAAAAYALAAPEIHALFPSADIFMTMVKQGYAPVYRHKSFEFGDSKIDGGIIAQRVRIIDANGEAWEALYTLETQADGSLKITGCSLLKAGQSV
jgi:hypothetical protein